MFRAAVLWYAVPAAQVVSISAPARPVRLPTAPPFVRGVAALAGKVVPVLATAILLGESSHSGEVARLVLLQDGARLAACEVAEILGIEDLPEEAGPPSAAPDALSARATGGTQSLGGRVVIRLHVDRLMDQVAFAVRGRA